ncbi:uncharacterized protein TNCV_4984931 [Trichonephila clavipes]|nr:uncharacterized protein TNCV_4984931 [Trichonephila clavipes]
MRDHTWHALSKGSSSITRLNCFPGLLSGSFSDRKHVVHGCSKIDPDYTPAAPQDQILQLVEAAWSAVPQLYIQRLFESMPRRVAAVMSNNGGYSGGNHVETPLGLTLDTKINLRQRTTKSHFV